MRLIIEVDNGEELERALKILQGDTFKNQPIQVMTPHPIPSRRQRQTILQQIYERYQIKLPEDWRFDRDEAHER